MSTTSWATSSRRAGEDGAGIIGSIVGVLIFLLLLLFAVQVVVGLYATTVVSAAAYDAAKSVAGADAARAPAAQADAEVTARRQIGAMGRRTEFSWAGTDADAVRLAVTAPRPTLLPAALTGPIGLGDIVRRVRVRVERVR